MENSRVINIIADIAEGVDLEMKSPLLGHNIDSFDVVNLVVALEEEFDFHIPGDQITSENFGTVAALIELVKKLKRG